MNELTNPPMEMMLEEIDRDECLRLMSTQSIGRLAVVDHGYYPPHIVPVNFTVESNAVIFRSDSGLKFKLAVLAEHSVSFEVDSIDRTGRMAWSVVVQGRAERLSEEDVGDLTYAPWLQPWAPGEKREWVRIVPYAITGRRLKAVPPSPPTDDRAGG